MFDGNSFLRMLAVSGLAGFFIFCASYALTVWIRRNRSSGARMPYLRKISVVFFILGVTAAAGGWIANEFKVYSGVVDGHNLFVAPTRPDARTEILARGAPVAEGELIAVFRSPAIDAQISAIEARIREAQIRIEALRSQPLHLDPTLVYGQSRNEQEREHTRALLVNLHSAKRELINELMRLSVAWTRELSQLDADIEGTRQLHRSAVGQIAVAEASLHRAKKVISVLQTERMKQNLLALELERDRSATTLAVLRRRLSSLAESHRAAADSLTSQKKDVVSELSAARRRSLQLDEKSGQIQRFLEQDRRRAKTSAAREIDAAGQNVTVLRAEKRRIIGSSEIRAPFAGRLVYRYSSAGLVPENMPAFAVSSGNGINVRVQLPKSSIREISSEPKVAFSLESAVLNKVFLGEFRRVEDVPVEGYVIAHFDAKLPPDALSLLGKAASSLPVQPLWRPSIFGDVWFLGGLLLVALSMLGQAVSLAVRRRESFDAELLRPVSQDQSGGFLVLRDVDRIAELGDDDPRYLSDKTH